MIATIPIIKAMSHTYLKRIWENPELNLELAEPITWESVTVKPNDGVKIVQGGFNYVTIPHTRADSFTVLFLTLEGPEEKLPKVEFSAPAPPIAVKGLARPKVIIEAEKMMQEKIAALQSKENAGG